MSIYVGDKKALLLKSDNSVVEFYKGDKKLFGYDGKAVGAPLSIGDVHPAEHNIGVKVASKNLIPYPYDYTKYSPYTQNGITITDNSDGSLTINGTATATVNYFLAATNTLFLPAGTYVMSNGNTNAQGYMLVGLGESELGGQVTGNKTFTLSTYSTTGYCLYQIPLGATFDNVTIYPQIELGTTATAYTPYVADLTGVEVARYGKNLFSPIYADYTQNRFYSYVYVGSVNMRMSFTDKDTTVDISDIRVGFMEDINNVNGGANWSLKNGTIASNNSNVNNSIACPYIVIYPNTEDVFNRVTSRYDIQVEIGTVTKYEPYKEPTIYTANADGTVEGVKSISPNMTLIPNNNAVTVECEYCKA